MTLIVLFFASFSSAVGASCVGMDRALARGGLKSALGRNPKQNIGSRRQARSKQRHLTSSACSVANYPSDPHVGSLLPLLR